MQTGLSKLLCEFYDEAQNSEPSCQGWAFIWTPFTYAAVMSLQHWFIVRGARTSLTELKLGCISPFSDFTTNLKKYIPEYKKEYALFLRVHETLMKTNHILSHK